MKADMMPNEIVMVLLMELLFGIGYNALVAWWTKHNLMHVSWAVVIGVTVTLAIPAVFWFDDLWKAIILLVMCFAASGVPMIVGSTRRTVAEKMKDQKKRREWPNAARRVREDVLIELSSMAHEIAEKAKSQELNWTDLPDYVNRIHGVIGTLKSV